MEFNTSILPIEKPGDTIGRPIVPFRKVLDGIVYVLRMDCQLKMFLVKRIWLWFHMS